MLTIIDIAKIFPHPDNPRQDLGDLTELAESMKANGILQNLTVIPQDVELYQRKTGSKKAYTGDYTVIIGHRRLAAAKLAGMSEVPCVITEMDMRTQVATMLLENMQRNDLTVWEQANGFQMMLNLGENVAGISEKTGFSQSTVRHRMKLLELNQEKFKKSESRGATLQDYLELEKLEDSDLKNDVLDSIGTNNFHNKLQQAIEEENNKRLMHARIAELEAFAVKIETNTSEMRYIGNYNSWDKKKQVERPDDAGEVKYFFKVGSYQIDLYKEQLDTDIDKEAEKAKAECEAELKRVEFELKEASKRAYNLRSSFVSNFGGTKKYMPIAAEFAGQTIFEMSGCWSDIDEDLLVKLLELELNEEGEIIPDSLDSAFSRSPEYALLVLAYCATDDENEHYYSNQWSNNGYQYFHRGNADLDRLYCFLERLGYQMSDEEHELQDGTHELYTQHDKAEQE